MNLKRKIIKILFKIPDPIYFFDQIVNRPGILNTFLILLNYIKNKKIIHLGLILDLIKKIYSLIVLIILSPIYLIFVIYLNKNNLYLVSINTWQIGAYIQQLDSLIKKYKKKKIYLICPDYLIDFKSFVKIYKKRNLKYSNNSALYFFVYPLLVFKEFSKDAFEFEVLNKNSKFNKIHRQNNYNYNFKEIFKKSNLPNNLNVGKLVTIHFKDEFFLSGTSSRVSNYKSYLKVIKWLTNRNYTVVRFVHDKSIKKIYDHKKYYELTTNGEREKIRQFFLIMKSKLFICTQSGPASYNFILKTPFLQVNSFPINVCFVNRSKDYLIYKFIKKKGKHINLIEMIKKNFHMFYDFSTHPDQGYSLVENSSNDILDATKNVINKNKSVFFSKILKQNKIDIPAKYSMAKIPISFYRKIVKGNN